MPKLLHKEGECQRSGECVSGNVSGSGSGSWSEGVGVGVGVGVRPQGFLDWEGFRKAAAGAPRLGGEWGAGRGMGWEEWDWQ